MAKTKRKKLTDLSVSQLKKVLWADFSRCIRREDAWRLSDETGTDPSYAQCCSCGVVKEWRKMDAGHFVSRKYNSLLFDERNVHTQCKPCNITGSPSGYAIFLLEEYGEGILEELNQDKQQIRPFKEPELIEMIGEYRDRLKLIKQN